MWFEIFNCIIINRVKTIGRIVISHVDVSSCGISLRRGRSSVFNLKG